MNNLTTDGIISLRAMEPADIDVLYRWENDTRFWDVTDSTAPFSMHLLREYVADYNADIYAQRQLRLIIERVDTRQPVGIADLLHFDPLNNRAELGLLIGPDFQRQGYGERAVKLLMSYACNHIGLRQIYVYIRQDHDHCLLMFEKLGFSRCGLLKKWVKRGKDYYDVALMQYIF